MQHNDDARYALLPKLGTPKGFWASRSNQEIFAKIGVSKTQIEHLEQLSQQQGKDALVLYCELNGITTLAPLLI